MSEHPPGRSPRPTHVDERGRVRVIDVSEKRVTHRRARAGARLRMTPATARSILDASGPKGEALATARIAGIQAAKQTATLIPLAHPLALSFIGVEIEVDPEAGIVEISAEARTTGQTGVEMEAMTACSVAALALYDMVKGIERGVAIERIVLLEKSGGRSNDWRREP